jgi:hypothetical protein
MDEREGGVDGGRTGEGGVEIVGGGVVLGGE